MIFEKYFELSEVTEPSKTLHRWCAMSVLATTVGTNVFVRYGNARLYPNLYIALVGTISSKYPAAIDLAKAAMIYSGRRFIAGDAQAIWDGLAAVQPEGKIVDALLQEEIPEDPTFVSGICQLDRQLEILEQGWNYAGILKQGKGKAKYFLNPRLNLLLSCTPDAFAQVFPSNNVNTHLLSQLIIINAGNPRKKLAWPMPYDAGGLAKLKTGLHKVSLLSGEMKILPEAHDYLTLAYNNWIPLADSRLMAYASHRQIQLIKISMLLAAEEHTLNIQKRHAVEAAKILTFAESQMPVALGEYGTDKQSYVRGRIMHLLNARFPATSTLPDIYKAVQQDVKNFSECADLVHSLLQAGKILARDKAFAPVTRIDGYGGNNFSIDTSTIWEGNLE